MADFKLSMNARKNIPKQLKKGVSQPHYFPEVYKKLMNIDYGQNFSDPLSMF